MHVPCSMSFHGQFMAHKDPALLLLKIKSDAKLHDVHPVQSRVVGFGAVDGRFAYIRV